MTDWTLDFPQRRPCAWRETRLALHLELCNYHCTSLRRLLAFVSLGGYPKSILQVKYFKILIWWSGMFSIFDAPGPSRLQCYRCLCLWNILAHTEHQTCFRRTRGWTRRTQNILDTYINLRRHIALVPQRLWLKCRASLFSRHRRVPKNHFRERKQNQKTH